MISETIQKQKSLGYKLVVAKIAREEFTRFQHYCEMNEETTNSALRKMILATTDNPTPSRIAGKSMFVYNKKKDNFAWRVESDDGTNFDIDDNLPVRSLEQLLEAAMNAIEERNSFIRKNKSDSVSIPSRLVRARK